MARELWIADRRIADDAPPFVIAEIGNNHCGDVKLAQQMIRVAATCGADAVKLQVRNNRALYSQALLDAPYANENSFGPTYGAHRMALELSEDDLRRTAVTATAAQVIWFGTAFDEASADRLMVLGAPVIKLASGALTDAALQIHTAKLGVPIIQSTGGASDAQIDAAVQRLSAHTTRFALLHCTAEYPAKPEHANLRCIPVLRRRYPDTVIGFSSHFTGLSFSLAAYAFGASIFEHHFTLDRAMKGTDHAFSLEPKGLSTLCDDLQKLYMGLGDGVKRMLDVERGPIAKMRRRQTANGWQITGDIDALD